MSTPDAQFKENAMHLFHLRQVGVIYISRDNAHLFFPVIFITSGTYGITTEELVIREIRIDEATGRDDSDSRMTSFKVIMPL